MSNPTELPDLDKLEALAKAAQISILRMGMNGRPNDYIALMNAMSPEAVLALIALARRAQPEGEAPQAEAVTCKGCNGNGMVGNILDTDVCQFCQGSGQESAPAPAAQHAESGDPVGEFQAEARQAKLEEAVRGWSKNAESGKDAEPMFDVETRDELTEAQNILLDHRKTLQELLICFMSWEPQVCVLGNVRADKAAAAIRAALAAQQAAAPGNSPVIPDGSTSAPGTPEAPKEWRKALHAAVSAIYFDDSSDYRWTLGAVVRHLDADLAAELISNPKAAYDRSAAQLDGGQEGSGSPKSGDAKDAARYRWLRDNCYDADPAGEGDAFDHPALHFESNKLDPYNSNSLDLAIDSDMRTAQIDGGQERSAP